MKNELLLNPKQRKWPSTINLKRLYCLGGKVLICVWWHLKEIFNELLKSRQDGQHCGEWMACWNRKDVLLGKEVGLWFFWVTAPIPMRQIQFHKGSKRWEILLHGRTHSPILSPSDDHMMAQRPQHIIKIPQRICWLKTRVKVYLKVGIIDANKTTFMIA